METHSFPILWKYKINFHISTPSISSNTSKHIFEELQFCSWRDGTEVWKSYSFCKGQVSFPPLTLSNSKPPLTLAARDPLPIPGLRENLHLCAPHVNTNWRNNKNQYFQK